MKVTLVAFAAVLVSLLAPVASVALSSKLKASVALSSKLQVSASSKFKVALSSKSKASLNADAQLVSKATELANQLAAMQLNLTEFGKLSPIQKVLDMLNELRMKVINEEKEAYILYSQYTALCDEEYRATSFLILSEEQEMDEFRAALRNELAEIAAMVAKIGKLTQNIAIKTGELRAARIQYQVDKDLYAKEIRELNEMILMMKKALEILESEKGQAFLQLNATATLAQTMQAMVKAATISYADSQRITALVQSNQAEEDEQDSLGAPTEIYQKQSGNIVDLLSSTIDQAEKQLDSAEKANAHTDIDFQLMEKALKDELERDEGELAEIRGDKPGAEAEKAEDEGNLIAVKDMLSITEKTRKLSIAECIDARDAFEKESKLREEEVIVQTKAINAIRNATGAETTHKFNFTTRLTNETVTFLQEKDKSDKEMRRIMQVSFLQEKDRSDAKTLELNALFRVVRLVRKLGREDNSTALKLLAMKINPFLTAKNQKSRDPFRKVKFLIHDMIYKLEKEQDSEADLHAWCAVNMAKAEKAVADAMAEQLIVQARFDAAEAAWMRCKREIQEIGKSGMLVENTVNKEREIRDREKAELDRIRTENQAAMEGVNQAIKILNEYYGDPDKNDATATDAAHTIVELLKIILVDLEKSLQNAEADDLVAQANFEKSLEEREVSHDTFERDLKYKMAEELKLREKVAELQQALDEVNERLADAHAFYDKIKEKCQLAARGFEDRIEKMKKELAGLKEALTILNEAAAIKYSNTPALEEEEYLQEGSRRSLRGSV